MLVSTAARLPLLKNANRGSPAVWGKEAYVWACAKTEAGKILKSTSSTESVVGERDGDGAGPGDTTKSSMTRR